MYHVVGCTFLSNLAMLDSRRLSQTVLWSLRQKAATSVAPSKLLIDWLSDPPPDGMDQ